MSSSKEQVIAGVTSGLIALGEEVTWRARHFGIWQKLTAKIIEFDRPYHFRDVMVRGAFKAFTHDHDFSSENARTIMKDVFVFESPMGILGHVANVTFLTRYMTDLLSTRAQHLKLTAESDEWKKYLSILG